MKNSKDSLERLIKDLRRFTEDWENLIKHSELAKNSKFLKNFADHIRHLDIDTQREDLPENVENFAHLIHHMLSTPFGAPIVSEKTLMEAALTLEFQDPIRSDLSEMTLEFLQLSPSDHNELVTLFHSFYEKLKKEL